MRELRIYAALLALAVVGAVVFTVLLGRAERNLGAAQRDRAAARADALAARLARNAAEVVRDSIARALARQESAYARATADAASARARLTWIRDSLRAAGVPEADVETVTVAVPLGNLTALEREASTCRVTLTTCRALAVAESTRAEAAIREVNAKAREVSALGKLTRRPWTAAGVALDARTGALGPFIERDLGPFRFGASVTHARQEGAALQLRAGIRF